MIQLTAEESRTDGKQQDRSVKEGVDERVEGRGNGRREREESEARQEDDRKGGYRSARSTVNKHDREGAVGE